MWLGSFYISNILEGEIRKGMLKSGWDIHGELGNQVPTTSLNSQEIANDSSEQPSFCYFYCQMKRYLGRNNKKVKMLHRPAYMHPSNLS